MSSAFCGEDKLAAETEGFAELIAWIFVERGAHLFGLTSVKIKAAFLWPTSPKARFVTRGR